MHWSKSWKKKIIRFRYDLTVITLQSTHFPHSLVQLWKVNLKQTGFKLHRYLIVIMYLFVYLQLFSITNPFISQQKKLKKIQFKHIGKQTILLIDFFFHLQTRLFCKKLLILRNYSM